MSKVQSVPTKHKITVAPGTINQVVVVRTPIDLPEAIYDKYYEQATGLNREVEDVMAQRLTRCVEQKDNGLFFNDAQKKRLDRCVGHNIGDAEGALQRLENLSKIVVDDVVIELDPKLKSRLASRATMRRKDLAKLIRDEVLMGLKRFAGLEPA